MEPKVIYEDDVLLVLDKPAGMVVNRSETTKETTVQEWLEKEGKVSKVSEVSKGEETFGAFGTFPTFDTFQKRAGIVHRLDKETSGILLVAKTPESFVELQRQFKEREVAKKYIALVHGHVEPPHGEISAPVGRLPWDREKFGVLPGGREARTGYNVSSVLLGKLENWKQKTDDRKQITEFSLLELTPTTGRTHQIRIHLKYLGYPIVGDLLYTGRKQAREDRRWCPRMFLHAAGIKFKHPKTKKIVEFESELPEDLKNVLRRLV